MELHPIYNQMNRGPYFVGCGPGEGGGVTSNLQMNRGGMEVGREEGGRVEAVQCQTLLLLLLLEEVFIRNL